MTKSEATFRNERDGRSFAARDARAATVGRTPDAVSTLPETPVQTPESPETVAGAAMPVEPKGLALPGDRGRESQNTPKQRPSFWRRIALGRRGAKARSDVQPMALQNPPAPSSSRPPSPRTFPTTSASIATRGDPARPQNVDSVEKRIVEPLLQALVSVESKLERSHIDLIGRSDQVEERLSQLWDIEEQLGALGEIQESLLQVAEQQRRLATAIATQNQTLRWMVGAVFLSLTLAAFVVAAVLQ